MKNAKAIVIANRLKSFLFKGEFDDFAQMFEELKKIILLSFLVDQGKIKERGVLLLKPPITMK